MRHAEGFDTKKHDGKWGLFHDKHKYYYSEKRHKRREAHLHFMADVFAMDEITPHLSYNAVALFLLISDMNYFESHVLVDRTGWAVSRIADSLKELISSGYVEVDNPETEFLLYKNKAQKTRRKYKCTTKYEKKYKEIVNRRNEILDHFEEVTGQKD